MATPRSTMVCTLLCFGQPLSTPYNKKYLRLMGNHCWQVHDFSRETITRVHRPFYHPGKYKLMVELNDCTSNPKYSCVGSSSHCLISPGDGEQLRMMSCSNSFTNAPFPWRKLWSWWTHLAWFWPSQKPLPLVSPLVGWWGVKSQIYVFFQISLWFSKHIYIYI